MYEGRNSELRKKTLKCMNFSYLNQRMVTWRRFKELHHPSITKQPLIHFLSRVFAAFWGIAVITTSWQLPFTLILEITSSRSDNAAQFTTCKPLFFKTCTVLNECVNVLTAWWCTRVRFSGTSDAIAFCQIECRGSSSTGLKAVCVTICWNLHHSIFYWPYVSRVWHENLNHPCLSRLPDRPVDDLFKVL